MNSPYYPCGKVSAPLHSRRDWLRRAGCGFGAVAASALLSKWAHADTPSMVRPDNANPLAPKPTHFAPKVKRVVYLYMDGGPSQVDTWDPKPQLTKENGQPFKMKIEPTQFNNIGNTLGSPWKFQQYGESGIPVSDLFPNIAKHVDKLAVVRSMVSNFPEHTNANYFLHTGSGLQGRPSMGAWACYGLGSECEELPGFIILNGGLIPPGGLDCFNSGFLPATYQGSVFNPGDYPLANIRRLEKDPLIQRRKLDLLAELDRGTVLARGANDEVDSAISNYELAFRMQASVPDLANLDGETDATKTMYGLDSKNGHTSVFAKNCLLARRLLERGVRFIELTCPSIGHDRWDQHGNLKQGHEDNARAVDQPIGAFLTDLSQRGMLDETLVIWSGEFGRTPFAQGSDGRDHNPFGFSLWMCGGGIKGGTIYGATDEYGYKAIENKVEIHDLHATMLHLLGMDHERLTFRYSGRDMRLTDVHGKLVKGILS
ncbi:MAG: DUF1501 domain-containing protein [Planctomycetota bacterium]